MLSEDFSKISEVVTSFSSSGSDFFSSFLKPNQERNQPHPKSSSALRTLLVSSVLLAVVSFPSFLVAGFLSASAFLAGFASVFAGLAFTTFSFSVFFAGINFGHIKIKMMKVILGK